MRQAELFVQADRMFSDYVAQIKDDQWGGTVPSAPDWTVRQLVDHVAHNNLALVAAVEGSPEPVDGDVLGDDPVMGWAESAEAAEDAADALTDTSDTVPGPLGEMTIGDFLLVQVVDRTVHAWDLAVAIGAEADLEPALVQAAHDVVGEHAEALRNAGAFGAEVQVGADASLQERLLALTGRDPGYVHEEPDTDVERAQEIHRS